MAWSQAFPINSNVALQPAEGQIIYRTQLRYRNFDIDGSNSELKVWTQSNLLVYGWTSRFSSVLGIPLRYRELDNPASDDHDFGIGDINFLLRYKLWSKLAHLESKSLTVIGGVQIPSYDDPFSSRSWDPVIGSVYSWRKNRHGADTDLLFQYNTQNDRDLQEGLSLRYNLNYQYRVWPMSYKNDTKWSLSGLLELNGNYQDEGKQNGRRMDESNSHQLFLSPGVVLSGKRTRYEAGVQFPVVQDIGDFAADDKTRFVAGVTMTF